MVFVLGSKSKTMTVESELLFKKKNKKTFHAQTEKPVSKGLQFRDVLM